ncbi:acyltransferase family protein [uncultured Helicobacter sp.]|uniref:acyltransferase family protein n=1 Tax=uncultured Helicobacter sp. TaxID=175537 RepID=UPI003750E6F3
MKVSYLTPLDSFRGIAALSVVLLHLHIYRSFTEVEFFRHGHLGVPFFFVLSGFIIAYVYHNDTFKFKDFLAARAFRILPLYWLVLFLFVAFECCKYIAYTYFAVSFGIPPFSEHKQIGELLPNFLLLQSWLPHTDSSSFNFPSWSLSIEWYLYLCFGLLMFAPKIVRYALFITLPILSFAHYLDVLRGEAQKGILFFFAGCVVYLIFAKLRHISLPPILLRIAEVMGLVAFLAIFQIGLDGASIIVFPFVVLVFALSAVSSNAIGGGGKHKQALMS